MNPSKLYVPNPQKWVKFYKHMADGKFRLHPTNQMGGGHAAQSFIAPIDKFVDQYDNSTPKQPSLKLVSTTEQMVDQAKSELKREGEDLKTLAQAIKGQKRKRLQSGKTSKSKRATGNKGRKSTDKAKKPIKKVRKNASKSKKPNRSGKDKQQTGGKTVRKQNKHNFIPRDIFDK